MSCLYSDNSALVDRVTSICNFPDEAERTRIISGLRWIGLFSKEPIQVRAGNLLDTLCARLEKLMKYEPGERDLIMLQHKFVVEWKDGKEVSWLVLVQVLYFLKRWNRTQLRPLLSSTATRLDTQLWR